MFHQLVARIPVGTFRHDVFQLGHGLPFFHDLAFPDEDGLQDAAFQIGDGLGTPGAHHGAIGMGHFVDGGPGRPDDQHHQQQGHGNGQRAGREGRTARKGRVHFAGIIDVIRHQAVQGRIQSGEQFLARHGLLFARGSRSLAEMLAQTLRHTGPWLLLPLGIAHEDQAQQPPDPGEQGCFPRGWRRLRRQCGKNVAQRSGLRPLFILRHGIRLTLVHLFPPLRLRAGKCPCL